MMTIVTGAVGGGKTLHCVGKIVEHLAKGGTIYTNIQLFPDVIDSVIRRRYRRIIEKDQIRQVDLNGDRDWHTAIDYGVEGSPILVVLDEIHIFFNSRNWAKTQKENPELLHFLSQSRKFDVDVIFIAQVAGQLEKQFRDQCEWEFFCRSLREVHVPIFGAVPFSRMILIQRDKHSDKPVRRQLLSYDKGLWGCYNTRAVLDSAMQTLFADRPRVPRRKLKRVPVITARAAVSLVVSALFFVSYYLTQ